MLDNRFIKGSPMPPNLGACADLYAEVRDLRLQMQKAVDEIHSRETEIYNAILSTLNESADTGASGKFYRVQRVEKDRLQVKSWDEFWSFVFANKANEMLQKRLSDKAVQEWIDTQGAPPPGVESVAVPSLSFNKVS